MRAGAADRPPPKGTPPAQAGAAHFPARLRWARKAAGLSLRALGEAAALSYESIRKMEAGRDAGAQDIERLAVLLSVAPAWLAFGVDLSGKAP